LRCVRVFCQYKIPWHDIPRYIVTLAIMVSLR